MAMALASGPVTGQILMAVHSNAGLSVSLARGAGGAEVADGAGGFEFSPQPGVVGGEPAQVRQCGLQLSAQDVPFPAQAGVLAGESCLVPRPGRAGRLAGGLGCLPDFDGDLAVV